MCASFVILKYITFSKCEIKPVRSLGWLGFRFGLEHPLQAVMGVALCKNNEKLSLSANGMLANPCNCDEHTSAHNRSSNGLWALIMCVCGGVLCPFLWCIFQFTILPRSQILTPSTFSPFLLNRFSLFFKGDMSYKIKVFDLCNVVTGLYFTSFMQFYLILFTLIVTSWFLLLL